MNVHSTINLPTSYDPQCVEDKWYSVWEQNNYFKVDPHSNKPKYCIVIPPPNITGILHMGHALVNTLQDVLIRFKRMQGFEALWIPGVDHAGIATQTVVERQLIKQEGKTRKELTREEFLKRVWDWKEQHASCIINQLKKLGCSCDWSRTRFTMDEMCSKAVRTVFKKMFDQGLIYQGDYLVNWDPVTQTALADDEVEYEEKKSFLWYLKYPIRGSSDHLTIATTRPETMLGDTAVAVNPKDERYLNLIGKNIILPIVGREIPIIADHHVDPSFGTGVVKITPAHDPNDYQIGLSHNLPFINIMTPDGKIEAHIEEFKGQTMLQCRENVVERFKALDLLEKIEPHIYRIGRSYRSKAIIEPYLSKQWFVKMKYFKDKLKSAVTDNKVKLIPKNWENTYNHWIDNLRDWCISRQLWWGHRIPIWYHVDDENKIICWDGEGVPPEVESSPDQWQQDEDVLDTWFSSALWPFSTLGWPDKTPELQAFYPNAVLVTGYDILFFWVARMIFMGEYVLEQVPFPSAFLHGLIYGKSYWKKNHHQDGSIEYIGGTQRIEYDLGNSLPKDVHSKWEKMSKSKGNIIDPLDIISQYGTDAMRLGLCVCGPQSREIDLDRRKFEDFKHFVNKIWNGARFTFLNLEENAEKKLPALDAKSFSEGLDQTILLLEDRWILSKMNQTIQKVIQSLDTYEFDTAALKAYDFFWKEFCAYYVEIIKPVLFGKSRNLSYRTNKQKILVIILCNAIRLIHPFAPFITEELFTLLKQRLEGVQLKDEQDIYTRECITALNSSACIVAPFPKVFEAKEEQDSIDTQFNLLRDLIYTLRNIRGEMGILPGMSTDLYLFLDEKNERSDLIKDQLTLIKALVKIETIHFCSAKSTLPFGSTGNIHGFKILIPLPNELKEREKQRLLKEQNKLILKKEKLEKQLNNPDFINKAPPQLVEKQQVQFDQLNTSLDNIDTKLRHLNI